MKAWHMRQRVALMLLKAAFASSHVSAVPWFGGGAGSVCRNHRHFISPWIISL